MLGRTHSRIALKIADELGIKEKLNRDLLVNGSNAPDSWANFPHHHGKEEEIKENILTARRLFLENDDECYHRLGTALHYIADRWTLRPRMSDKHTEWEMLIEGSPILNNAQLQKSISESSLPTKEKKNYKLFLNEKLRDLEKEWYRLGINYSVNDGLAPDFFDISYRACVRNRALCNRPSTWSSPLIDLNIAYRICSQVAREVLRPLGKKASNPCLKAAKLVAKIINFPYGYFGDDFTLGKLGEALDITRKAIRIRFGRWDENGILSFDPPEHYQIDEIKVPGNIEEKVTKKVPHWLFKGKLVDKVEIQKRSIEKQFFRVSLEVRLGSWDDYEFYIDCPSNEAANYVKSAFRSIAANPNCTVRQNAKAFDKGDFKVYIRLDDFLNFPIPQEPQLTEMMKSFDNDVEALKDLRGNPATWF